VILSLTIIIINIAFGVEMFQNTPFFLLFLLFFSFGIAFQTISYTLSTVCKDIQKGYTASYFFILLGLVMELFLSSRFIIYQFYRTSAGNIIYY